MLSVKIQNILDKIESDISQKQKKLEYIRNELKSITAELANNENNIIRFESSHIQGLQIIKNREIELEDLEDLFKKTKTSYDQLKPKIDKTDKLFISIDTDIKDKTNNLEMEREKTWNKTGFSGF